MSNLPILALLKWSAAFTGVVILGLLSRRYWLRAQKRHPLAPALEGEGGLVGWLLTIAVSIAAFMGMAAAWLLVFVAFVCFLYSAGLVYGEIVNLLGVLPPTVGMVLFHLTFPAQMFLMGIFVLLLVLGPMQLVIGPLPASRFVFFRVDDIDHWVGRMALLLGLVAALELARTVVAGGLLEPENWREFFAWGTTPLSDPTGLALLVAATGLGALIVYLWTRRSK